MAINTTLRVLVMDDEEPIRSYCGLMLSHLGHKSHAVCHGEEALSAYQEGRQVGEPFDLVILDIKVPHGMGGEETIKQLSQIDPDVKAVISSGYRESPLMVNYKEYGFKAALSKPYDIQELTNALSTALT